MADVRINPWKMSAGQIADALVVRYGHEGAVEYLAKLIIRAGCANYGRKYVKARALLVETPQISVS